MDRWGGMLPPSWVQVPSKMEIVESSIFLKILRQVDGATVLRRMHNTMPKCYYRLSAHPFLFFVGLAWPFGKLAVSLRRTDLAFLLVSLSRTGLAFQQAISKPK
jgi:hypothetical protein